MKNKRMGCINRDRNSVLNMLKIVKEYLKSGNRLKNFTSEIVSNELNSDRSKKSIKLKPLNAINRISSKILSTDMQAIPVKTNNQKKRIDVNNKIILKSTKRIQITKWDNGATTSVTNKSNKCLEKKESKQLSKNIKQITTAKLDTS